MATYRLRLLDLQRRIVSEEQIELGHAASPPTLGEVMADGRKVLAVQELRTAGRGAGGSAKPLKAADVAWWCRELRTLIQAGMTVVEAIETMQDQAVDAARHDLQRQLLLKLQQGMALSNAMQGLNLFPSVLVASVRASERTSSLGEALADYLRYHEMVDGLRKKVVSAAIYPLLVLVLGVIVSLFLLIVVLPRFATMYADLRGSMNWSTQLLVTASRFVRGYQLELGLGLLVGSVLLVAAWRQGLVQQVLARLGLAIGPVARAVHEFRLAKLFHSMTVMFKGGYTLDEVLARCDGLALGSEVEQGLTQARQSILRGVQVSTAFAEARLADRVTQRLLAVGERSGNFERCLQTIAERHAEAFATFMERATRIVEPLLLLAVALLVGSIVVLMYLPIFDIASSIR